MSKKPKPIVKYDNALSGIGIQHGANDWRTKPIVTPYSQAVKAIPHVERLIEGLRKSAGK